MGAKRTKTPDIDSYIAAFPPTVRARLRLDLIAEIVEFRLAENLARYAPKADAKRSTRGGARRKARAT